MKARAGLAAAVGLLVLSACVPHPVGPARSLSKFEGKARTTAKSALSDVETARLAAQTGGKGDAFGAYLSVLLSETEDRIAGVQGTFDSIQPPGDQADALAQQLDAILTDALAHVRDVRVAARRGEIGRLPQLAAPLDADSANLSRFVEAHS
jgi:hypothetical protein